MIGSAPQFLTGYAESGNLGTLHYCTSMCHSAWFGQGNVCGMSSNYGFPTFVKQPLVEKPVLMQPTTHFQVLRYVDRPPEAQQRLGAAGVKEPQ